MRVSGENVWPFPKVTFTLYIARFPPRTSILIAVKPPSRGLTMMASWSSVKLTRRVPSNSQSAVGRVRRTRAATRARMREPPIQGRGGASADNIQHAAPVVHVRQSRPRQSRGYRVHKEAVMKRFCLAAIALGVFAGGCSSDPVGPPPRITALPRSLTPHEQSLIQADNRLAIKLLQQVNADTRDTMPNLFISPLSVAMALAMAYIGAATTTADAMRSTLELDGMTVPDVNEAYRSLIKLLRNLDPHVQFQIANSVWYRQGYAVKRAFLDVNRDYYDAQVTSLDFLSPSAPATINAWVSQQTHGLIDEIVESIPDYMRLYLIDAIYFKGDWTAQFDANLTQPRPFRLEDGSFVNVPTMARGEAELRTVLRPNATVVDLSYGGQAFSMTIVIPDDSSSVDHLVMALTAEQWDDWTGNLHDAKAELQLPKFKLTNDLGLIPTLG